MSSSVPVSISEAIKNSTKPFTNDSARDHWTKWMETKKKKTFTDGLVEVAKEPCDNITKITTKPFTDGSVKAKQMACSSLANKRKIRTEALCDSIPEGSTRDYWIKWLETKCATTNESAEGKNTIVGSSDSDNDTVVEESMELTKAIDTAIMKPPKSTRECWKKSKKCPVPMHYKRGWVEFYDRKNVSEGIKAMERLTREIHTKMVEFDCAFGRVKIGDSSVPQNALPFVPGKLRTKLEGEVEAMFKKVEGLKTRTAEVKKEFRPHEPKATDPFAELSRYEMPPLK